MKKAIYLGKTSKGIHKYICPNCENFNFVKKSNFVTKRNCAFCDDRLVFEKCTGNGFNKGFSLAFILFFIVLLSVAFIPLASYNNTKISTLEKIPIKVFETVSKSWENSQEVNEFVIECRNSDQIKEVKCIYSMAMQKQNYGEDKFLDKISNSLNKVDEVFKNKGLCRDYAVFVSAVLNKLDIENRYMVDMPEHIYNIAYLDNGTECKIDIAMGSYSCG